MTELWLARDFVATPGNYCNATLSNSTLLRSFAAVLPLRRPDAILANRLGPVVFVPRTDVRGLVEIYWNRFVPEYEYERARKGLSNDILI